MKQMYAVVLGDDDGKSIDSDRVFCLEHAEFTANNHATGLIDRRKTKCYVCKVMVDIVRVGDDE